jgi:2-amino-4-hydroxy-6-hydroxymethyldihydropteridine diphosphokinase
MNKAYLSLGTNLGDKKSNILFAITQIDSKIGNITAKSHLYATAPWGFESKNEFFNMALTVDTCLEPFALLEELKKIENEAGRKKTTSNSYEDRLLDIDLLLYNDVIFQSELLEIPHPRLHLRKFVLIPLLDIAPQLVHPVFQKTMIILTEICPDTSILRRIG